MNALAGVAAQIGAEETGGDRVAGICHQREGHGRQHGPQ